MTVRTLSSLLIFVLTSVEDHKPEIVRRAIKVHADIHRSSTITLVARGVLRISISKGEYKIIPTNQ